MELRSFLRAGLPLTISVLPLLPLLFVAGCGGANNPIGSTSATGSTSSPSAFASRSYNSTVNLGGGQSGALALSVGPDGTTATGTLTVTSGAQTNTRQAQTFTFSAGTYSVRGTVDPATGAFQLIGSADGQAFTLQGALPTATSSGSYTLTAGGETVSGTFPALGTVPTPNPGATATPTPLPPTTPPVSGSGQVAFQVINRSADCNLDEALITSLTLKAAKYTPASAVPVAGYNAYGLSTTSTQTNNSNSGTFALGYVYTDAPNITPATFTFDPNADLPKFNYAPLTLLETSEVNGLSVTIKQWRPSGGTLTIESVSGKTIKLRGENVVFTAVSEASLPFLKSAGTFTANFTLTLDNVEGL